MKTWCVLESLKSPLSLSSTHRALIDCLINPLQDQIEDWKKGANTLDKDHAKGEVSSVPNASPDLFTLSLFVFPHYLLTTVIKARNNPHFKWR